MTRTPTQGDGAGRRPGVSEAKGGGLVVLIVLAVLFPQVFSNPAVTNYGVLALIFATAAVGWHVFSGNTGYISLGQAVFYGSGAYAMGIAARDWHIEGTGVFALIPLSAAVGAAIAIPFGLIALRVRRHTFIVITIAIFFIFQLMAFNFWFTGGSSGLGSPFLSWAPIPYNRNFYYIALACTAGSVIIAWLVGRSRFGLQLRAIRDDEDRARGLGVKAMRVKLSAFVLSGAITAMIGAVWFYYIEQVQPQTGFNPLFAATKPSTSSRPGRVNPICRSQLFRPPFSPRLLRRCAQVDVRLRPDARRGRAREGQIERLCRCR